MENNKGQFKSNFGFLMAALGSAVGLGNLWSFPYKLGMGGGFAFLLLYVVLCVTVGYPLVLSEIALGRKTQKAAIEAYGTVSPKWKFNGVLQTLVPFLLICFYCTFGGYITRYLVGSVGAFFGGSLATTDPGAFFGGFYGNVTEALIYMLVFLAITVVIVLGGVSGGIEKFCKIAMPALFGMLVIIVVRACTLPGAGEGLAFLFKPNFSGMTTLKGFFDTLSLAGGQMFFSLSLASACLIAYGSYLSKGENLKKDSVVIVIGDSLVAILAGMAIMPAVFSFGLEPGAGPGLLFVSMTTVFQSMGMAGKVFQLLFWALVFIAALSSSIGMMEGGISAIMDSQMKKGKTPKRWKITFLMAAIALVGNFLTTADCLGECEWMQWLHIFGQPDVLDVWDCIAEGILMPLTGLIMALILGWFAPKWVEDEFEGGKKFYRFCIKFIGPLFMLMIVYGQLTAFWG